MNNRRKRAMPWVCLFVLVCSCLPAVAQEQNAASPFASLNWQTGPTSGKLGTYATIDVPEGYRFLGKGDAARFMELLQNPSDGSELGVLLNDDASWFILFEFADEGYVKDDDRELDADAILDSIREGTRQANEMRQERGWGTVEVVGWQQEPFYDPATNNLTWSIIGRSDSGDSVNHSTRLLGRRGYMKVNLVMAPEDAGTAIPEFGTLMSGFSYNAGQRYSEFTRGDKVAQYGLTGLIVGGAGVALVKTGFLQKFWKLIVLGFFAVVGAIKKFFASMGRRPEAASESGASV